MIKITDKYGRPLVRIEKINLPITIEDVELKKKYYIKQGTKKDSGLFMNSQELINKLPSNQRGKNV